MEFGIREIVALLVLLVLAGIAVGLLLRYRRNQYGQIKSKIRYRFDKEERSSGPEEYGSELPSGGARVVGYRHPDDINTVHQRIRQQAEASRPKLSMFRDKPEQTALGLEDEPEQADIPMLLDPAEMEPEVPSPGPAIEEDEEISEPEDPLFMEKITAPPEMRVGALDPEEVTSKPEPTAAPDAPAQSLDTLQEESERADPAESQEDEDEPLEVLVLNLMAPEGTMLGGAEIDAALKTNGLQFGAMDIYHLEQGGKSLFSVANILNPGTFTQTHMDEFATPGLCFFMTLSSVGENLQRFEQMLHAGIAVAEQLEARLHDEQRSVITRQTLEHYRNRIRDYERQRMLR